MASMGGSTKVSGGIEMGKLTDLANSLLKQTGPVRKALMGQMLEALQTGGVGARIPMIQRAVEASKQATSQALTDTKASLASANLDRTPYGAATEADVRTSGELAASQIPTGIAESVITQTPALFNAVTAPGLSATEAALNAAIGVKEFNVNSKGRFLDALRQSLEFAGSGGKGGGSATPTAPPTNTGTVGSPQDQVNPGGTGVTTSGVAWDQIKALFGSGQSSATFGY